MYWLNKDAPIQFRWEPTFDTNDKEPFGAYAFDKILNDSWTEEYYHNYYSFYDIAVEMAEYPEDDAEMNYDENDYENYDTVEIQPEYNLLVIANYLDFDSIETKILLEYIEKGGSVILATNSISGKLKDTLNISINRSFDPDIFDLSVKQKEEEVLFCARDPEQIPLILPQPLVKNYLEIPDTANYAYFDFLYRISVASNDKTISIRYAIGEGSLIIVSNPLIFTNYGILNDSINPYIRKHLAYLEGKPLMRTEFYEKGSQGGKSQSEFRVILREKAFNRAYYTLLAGILIFMVFTAKRKQKIIPIIKPPANKMLEFVRSIAGLYLLKSNNADLIMKKQIYWGEELKRKYGIDIVNEQHNYDFYKRVAVKTRRPFDEICRLFLDLEAIDEAIFVPDNEMMRLVAKMNEI